MTRTGSGLSEGSTIRIRVTDEQKELIRKAAKYEGLEMSSWMRQLALERARKVAKG